jgi:hypothetical protein
MKKQLIAAALISSVSAVAIADVSITGNAKYEYFSTTDGTNPSKDTSNTEVNLGIKGKTGDTTVVMNMEFNTHGSIDTNTNPTYTYTSTISSAVDAVTGDTTFTETTSVATTATATGVAATSGVLDIEDLYMTTKIGDVNVKAGNWVSGTSSLGGEIKEDTRATNKIDLRTTIGGATIYAGNSGLEAGAGSTPLNRNMYYGVVFDLAGNKVELKHVGETSNESVKAYGINGSMAGVNYRLEQYQDIAANGDTTFGNITTEINGITLGYAFTDADKAGQMTQDDSSIYAVEGTSSMTNAMGNDQVTVSTNLDGNKITIKSGSIDKGIDASTDLDYMQIGVSRALASGATASVTFTDKDKTSSSTTETLEVELSVAF